MIYFLYLLVLNILKFRWIFFFKCGFTPLSQDNTNEQPAATETQSPFVNDGQTAFCFDPR